MGNHEEDQAGNGMLDASGNVDVVNIRCSMSSVPHNTTATNTHIRQRDSARLLREVGVNREIAERHAHGLSGGKRLSKIIFG